MKYKIFKGFLVLMLMATITLPRSFTVFAQNDSDIDEIISNMTQQEKLGQLLMLDFRFWNGENGETQVLEMNSEIREIISTYKLGGVIIFGENIKSVDQVVKLTDSLQKAVSNDIGLMLAIDQEGGLVSRFKLGALMPGNMALAATRDSTLVYDVSRVIGDEIFSLGINTNFAPSVDINTNYLNPIIGTRSFSSEASIVTTMSTAYIKGLHAANVAASAKHFPGHGDTAIDSHLSLPYIDKSYNELMDNELQPFFAAVDAKIDLLMVGHIVAFALDNSDLVLSDNKVIKTPATFSKKILKDFVRNDMAYKGVIITDALDMKAVSNSYSEGEIVVKTLAAGADIALMPTSIRKSSDIVKLDRIFQAINEAIKNNILSQDEIEASVYRILKLKKDRGIINYQKDTSLKSKIEKANKVTSLKENKDLAKEATEKAVTLLKNKDKILPFNLQSNDKILVMASSENTSTTIGSKVESIIKNKNITNVSIDNIIYNDHSDLIQEDKEKISKAKYIILETSNLSSSTGYVSQAVLYANSINKKLVSIAAKNPYDIMFIENIPASLAVYGFDNTVNTSGDSFVSNLSAGVGAIFNEISPTGNLPVTIYKLNKDILYNLNFGLTYNNDLNIKDLLATITKAESLDAKLYTKDSYAILSQTLKSGESLINKYNNDQWSVSQEDIDAEVIKIEGAILNLTTFKKENITYKYGLTLFTSSLVIILFLLLFKNIQKKRQGHHNLRKREIRL